MGINEIRGSDVAKLVGVGFKNGNRTMRDQIKKKIGVSPIGYRPMGRGMTLVYDRQVVLDAWSRVGQQKLLPIDRDALNHAGIRDAAQGAATLAELLAAHKKAAADCEVEAAMLELRAAILENNAMLKKVCAFLGV